MRLNNRLRKQSICWWFEAPLCWLWCHCNDHPYPADCLYSVGATVVGVNWKKRHNHHVELAVVGVRISYVKSVQHFRWFIYTMFVFCCVIKLELHTLMHAYIYMSMCACACVFVWACLYGIHYVYVFFRLFIQVICANKSPWVIFRCINLVCDFLIVTRDWFDENSADDGRPLKLPESQVKLQILYKYKGRISSAMRLAMSINNKH